LYIQSIHFCGGKKRVLFKSKRRWLGTEEEKKKKLYSHKRNNTTHISNRELSKQIHLKEIKQIIRPAKIICMIFISFSTGTAVTGHQNRKQNFIIHFLLTVAMGITKYNLGL